MRQGSLRKGNETGGGDGSRDEEKEPALTWPRIDSPWSSQQKIAAPARFRHLDPPEHIMDVSITDPGPLGWRRHTLHDGRKNDTHKLPVLQ